MNIPLGMLSKNSIKREHIVILLFYEDSKKVAKNSVSNIFFCGVQFLMHSELILFLSLQSEKIVHWKIGFTSWE